MRLTNSRPSFARKNEPNGSTAYPEHRAYSLGGYASRGYRPNSTHVGFDELVVPHSGPMRHSIAGYRVADIVGMGPEIQMVGADASLVVALVQNQKAVGYIAVGQLVGHPMCPDLAAVQTERSVTAGTGASEQMSPGPLPASVTFDYLRPEAIHVSIIQAFH